MSTELTYNKLSFWLHPLYDTETKLSAFACGDLDWWPPKVFSKQDQHTEVTFDTRVCNNIIVIELKARPEVIFPGTLDNVTIPYVVHS